MSFEATMFWQRPLMMFRMATVPLFHQWDTAKTTLLTSVAAIFGTSYFGVMDLNEVGTAMGVGVLTASVLYILMPLLRYGMVFFVSSGGFLHSGWGAVSTSIRFGSHMAVLRFMDQYLDDPKDAQETLTILQTMTASEVDPHLRRVLGEMGGIEMAVKALNKYSEDDADDESLEGAATRV